MERETRQQALPITGLPQSPLARLLNQELLTPPCSSSPFPSQLPHKEDEAMTLLQADTTRKHRPFSAATSCAGDRYQVRKSTHISNTYLICGTPDLLVNLSHRQVQTNDFIVH